MAHSPVLINPINNIISLLDFQCSRRVLCTSIAVWSHLACDSKWELHTTLVEWNLFRRSATYWQTKNLDSEWVKKSFRILKSDSVCKYPPLWKKKTSTTSSQNRRIQKVAVCYSFIKYAGKKRAMAWRPPAIKDKLMKTVKRLLRVPAIHSSSNMEILIQLQQRNGKRLYILSSVPSGHSSSFNISIVIEISH